MNIQIKFIILQSQTFEVNFILIIFNLNYLSYNNLIILQEIYLTSM